MYLPRVLHYQVPGAGFHLDLFTAAFVEPFLLYISGAVPIYRTPSTSLIKSKYFSKTRLLPTVPVCRETAMLETTFIKVNDAMAAVEVDTRGRLIHVFPTIACGDET